MRWMRRLLIGMLLATTISVGGEAAVAEAEDLPPAIAKLRVEGGEDNWHPEEIFRLRWEQAPGSPAASGVGYRLYDSEENPIGLPVTGNLRALERVEVPDTPGLYGIEAWLLDEKGRAGPGAIATLRFDNTAPAPPSPEAPSRWLLGTEQAVLKIGAPPLPHPISGIRGYAVSINPEADSHPCENLERCADGELDLRTEGNRDSVPLGLLPEGRHVARVVAVSGAGISSEVATATFNVDATPPELSVQGAPTDWSSKPVQVSAHAHDALSGMAAAGPDGPFTAIAVDGAPPTLAWGGQSGAWVVGSGVHRLDLFARDAAGNVAGGEALNPPLPVVVKIDEDPPRVAFAPTQDPSEPERLEAIVVDALSGPSASRGSIALRPAGTNTRFQELPTEVIGERLVAHWDSDAFPHGKYEFLATGFDVAGNPGTGTARDRGARMVLVNPVKAQVSLEAGFAARKPGWQSAKRVRLGRSVRFGGRLRRLGGSPIAGEEVVVTETFDSGAEVRQRTTGVRTSLSGTFSVRLAPGPSREVVATYYGNRALTRAAGSSARLTTTTSVRFRASAATARVGGRPVLFSGKVGAVGAKRAARGLPVELQFRYPGAGWSGFRTVETDSRGRFRYAYRFSDDDSRGVRFQFRAHVKGREGWPYEPSASQPVTVRGR